MPETPAPVLLHRKAAKLRKETGDDKYRTLEELEKKPFLETIKIALIRPFIMIFTGPIIIFMSICMPIWIILKLHLISFRVDLSFVYSLLYLLFFAFPIAFGEIRGFGLGVTGITFIGIMIGVIALTMVPMQEKVYSKATSDSTFPKARLYPMMLGDL